MCVHVFDLVPSSHTHPLSPSYTRCTVAVAGFHSTLNEPSTPSIEEAPPGMVVVLKKRKLTKWVEHKKPWVEIVGNCTEAMRARPTPNLGLVISGEVLEHKPPATSTSTGLSIDFTWNTNQPWELMVPEATVTPIPSGKPKDDSVYKGVSALISVIPNELLCPPGKTHVLYDWPHTHSLAPASDSPCPLTSLFPPTR